jgi:hypothetical protein
MMLCEPTGGLQPDEQFECSRRQKLSVIAAVFSTYFKLFITSLQRLLNNVSYSENAGVRLS